MTAQIFNQETEIVSESVGPLDTFMKLPLHARVAKLTAMTDAGRELFFRECLAFYVKGGEARSEFWIEADQIDLFTAPGDVVRAHVRYVKTDTEWGVLMGLIALRGMIATVTGRPF